LLAFGWLTSFVGKTRCEDESLDLELYGVAFAADCDTPRLEIVADPCARVTGYGFDRFPPFFKQAELEHAVTVTPRD
jgi:hypothetical protein